MRTKTLIMKNLLIKLCTPVVLLSAMVNMSYAFTGLPANEDLPVTWLYFKTEINDNSISLNWGTMAEPEDQRFELQRSEDGESYQVIVTLSGRGDNTGNNHYEAMDNNVKKGTIYYYRISMTGPDGFPVYSRMAAVRLEKNEDNNLVRIHPNPVPSTLIVNFNNERAQSAQITISDFAGNTCFSRPVQKSGNSNGQLPIQVGTWPTGWYVLKIVTSDGNAQAARFFIHR
jgi:hypothetical protein